MKLYKLLFLLTASVAVQELRAQSYLPLTGGNISGNLNVSGNLGIGTTTPAGPLHVYQTERLDSIPGAYLNITTLGSNGGLSNRIYDRLWIVRKSNGHGWTSTSLHEGIAIDVSFQTPMVDTKTWWERDPYHDIQSWGTAENSYLTIKQGNVGIGTETPQSRLAVNGTITAKQVTVTQNGWPDYVFDKDYPLPPLDSLSEQIHATGHLPGIPSTEEIRQNGQDLGEMNKMLLQKVEELTLYIIDLKKEVKQQGEKLKQLEDKGDL